MATRTEHQDKLELLRDILLPEEHKALEELSQRILSLEHLGKEQKDLVKNLEKVMDQKLENHKKELKENLGPALLKTLNKEISRDPKAVAALMAPLTATLLENHKKERKKNRSNRPSAPIRSLRDTWKSFTGIFKSSSESKKLEKQLKSAVIEQVLLIDRKSGNLKASFAETEIMDKSKISVLCGLINDHIQKHNMEKDQHLGVLSHGRHQIHIQGFMKHFVALVISGRKQLHNKEKMQDIIFSFYYQFMSENMELMNPGKESKDIIKTIDRKLLDKAMTRSFRTESS